MIRRARATHRRPAVIAVALAVVATMAACSSAPDPEPTAQSLADGLAAGDLTDVPITGATAEEATAQWSEVTEGLGGLSPAVDVASIEEGEDDDGEFRTVQLDLSWSPASPAPPESPAPGDGPTPEADGTGDSTAGTGDAPTGSNSTAEEEATSTDETTSPDEATSPDGSAAAEEPVWSYSTSARLTPTEDGWEVTWSPAIIHPDIGDGDRLVLRHQQPARGDILGAGGEVLVTDRIVYRIGLDKTRVDAAAAATSAQQLATLVDVDAAAFAARVESAGEKAFVEAITLREAEAVPIITALEGIPGASAVEDSMSLAPTATFARPILGTVGEATAEIIEESGGALQAGDVVGLSGLQERYDDVLRGTQGVTIERVPAEGEAEVLHESAPVAGEPVTTTLDPAWQERAESILAGVGPASAIVAVQPSTGNVLAAASGPGGEGYSTATVGQYAPGSTFKVVTSLALLRAGVTPDTTLQCPATLTVEGKGFKNYDDYPPGGLGDIPLRTAVANSCNTAFIGQRDTVQQADLTAAAASLGLGMDRDLGAPAFLGEVPADAEGTEHAASMIGQGRILASPLAMATVAASVAQGATVVPQLVVPPAGRTEPSSTPTSAPDPLTAAEAEALQAMMREVVTSGSGAFLADVPGDPVGAKTGTAEYGEEVPPRTHGWMIATQGDLAVAVMVEDAVSGSQTAGPLLEAFLTGP